VKDYVLTLLVAAAVTYILTPLVRRMARRVGAMKQPRERDVHVVPVPTLGGLAMFGGLAAGLLVADQIPQLRHGFANTGMISGLLLAGGLLTVIGFIDDRWGMGALPKAAGQVAAGGILVATGTSLTWLPLPGGSTYVPTADQSTFLTILVVVATINAVNFIDGLDGLAAGIVCIAATSFFLYYYSLTKVLAISSLAAPALASAILIGMCLGFLPHNFSPASIFMGDTGSMLLGLLLAYAPISSISSLDPAYLTHEINRYPEIMPLLLPAALLVIPYGDLLLAVVRRTRAGRSPFAPDRKHLHHRLLDIGHSQRASVLIMYLWAAAFSGSIVWLSIDKTEAPRASNHHGSPIFVFVIITVAAVAALLLMSMPRLRWWQRPRLAAQSAPAAAIAGLAAEADSGTASGPEPVPVIEPALLAATGSVSPAAPPAAADSGAAHAQPGGADPDGGNSGRDYGPGAAAGVSWPAHAPLTDPSWQQPERPESGWQLPGAANGAAPYGAGSNGAGSNGAGSNGAGSNGWAAGHLAAAPIRSASGTAPPPGGERPGGERPGGERPGGERPGGERPACGLPEEPEAGRD